MRKIVEEIRFSAKVSRPAEKERVSWLFIHLPQDASSKLPSRSMCSVEGTINGTEFAATLPPDGEGGHWLKVTEKLQKESGVRAGDAAEIVMRPAAVEPEPEVPSDLLAALATHPKARETWEQTTAVARRDWIQWISIGKLAETRQKRIDTTLDKLGKGMKRACCFDRSGMVGDRVSCPIAEE
jgi:hypothetical protein